METFINVVSTTRTNMAIASKIASFGFQAPTGDWASGTGWLKWRSLS
jgi:hypothetical protein